MKPIFIAALLLVSRMDAITPATTYTFVDPCTPFVTINAIPGTHGCYSFTASSGIMPGQQGDTFSWKFGDGASATGSLVAHCYDPETVTTIYTGTLTYNSPALCGVQPTEKVFTVSVPTSPSGTCVTESPEVLVSAKSVTVQGGVSIPEMMRNFNYGDGPSFDNSPYHSYTGCGPFVITIKSWDMNFPNDVCYAYHAVNFDCKEITTGIPEVVSNVARAYPNPCVDRLFIESKKTPLRVDVIDILGKTRQVNIEEKNQGISLSTKDFECGIFFVKIEYLDKSADVLKIVKD